MTWRSEALCAGSLLWIEEAPTRAAKAWMASVCALCPVQKECRDEVEDWLAVANSHHDRSRTSRPIGVWAGRYYGSSLEHRVEPVLIPVRAPYVDGAA